MILKYLNSIVLKEWPGILRYQQLLEWHISQNWMRENHR